jgi:hypothetical protein
MTGPSQPAPPTDSEERRFIFFFESDRLLRKGARKSAGRRVAQLEEDFRRAAEENATLFGFRRLKGPVSVLLHVHPSGEGPAPQLPPVVKAYLDALQGIAYVDDRQVEHLIVFQDALRHPLMSEDGKVFVDGDQDTRAAVFLEVEPLEDYTKRFDRAYRSTLWRRGPTPWRRQFTLSDETKLRELRRAQMRSLETANDLLRHLEEEKLRDGFLADIDRPGPLTVGAQKVHSLLALPKLHQTLRRRSGAMLLLPLPGQRKGTSAEWAATCGRLLDNYASASAGVPFRGFVGLDIAVRGETLEGKDLDNLAHSILAPLETKLCVRRGTVLGYRVYTAVGKPEGVQVRILDHARLLDLVATLGKTEVDPPLLDRLEEWAEKIRSQGERGAGK